MFALQAEAESAWRKVAPGIELMLKPAGTEALNAARRAVRDALRLDPLADPEFAFVLGAVVWAATDWRGIGDEAGNALPLSAEALGRLLRQRPDIYADLDIGYVHSALELLSEGNGSRGSPNGTSAAAPPTAKRARPATTTRKPATSRTRKPAAPVAPTESTNAGPTPATAPGER